MSQPLIKMLLLAGIAAVAYLALRGAPSARSKALWRLAGAGVIVTAAFSVLFPGALNSVAQALGVGRGADLVLYLLVVAFMLVIVVIFRRIFELEARLTSVIRQLAILDVERSQRSSGRRDEETRS